MRSRGTNGGGAASPSLFPRKVGFMVTKKGEQKETGKQARNTPCTKDKQDFN
jgi:hypothetical protein